jgi:SAM-dependent methyltransferase
MLSNNSDETWEYYGRTDPYFGVLTQDSFRRGQMTSDAKAQFLESGRRYVEWIVDTIRSDLEATFSPERGLDFGCGVGRLTIPLAKVCKNMVGVDVSESMLAEARNNALEQSVSNVTFVKGDDGLTKVTGPLDFVHSFIVFQHIPPERGEVILKQLVELLRDDGIGALHFTCSWSSKASLGRRLLTDAYRLFPPLYGVRNLAKGRPFREPMMQMNAYDLNRLFRILQESGCHRVQVRFTETGYFGHGFYGAVILFQKRKMDVQAHG